MFFKPRWYHVLPAHIRPPKEKLDQFEELRKKFQMRDDTFLVAIASSPWAVVRAQEAMRESLRRQFPDADERKLWSAVLLSRYEIKLKSPAPWDPPPDEIQRRMESIDETMADMHTWDDVLKCIMDMDKSRIAADSSSPQALINALLESA